MRTLTILAALITAQIGAAWALGDINTARPGATFSTVEAESAGSCERLCVQDTLCMAWSFHDNLCELKAVVPAAVAQDGAISGVSARAPASLRRQARIRETTIVAALETSALAPPVEPGALSEPTAATDSDISDQLLGGLETDGGIRERLGN